MPVTSFADSMTPQDALVAVMIAVSASDERMRTEELVTIERIVNHLPAFADYDQSRLAAVSSLVVDVFAEEDGLEQFFDLIRRRLPEPLFETAYALACDVAAASGRVAEMEQRLLEEFRYELQLDPLHAVAIEHAARVRHRVP